MDRVRDLTDMIQEAKGGYTYYEKVVGELNDSYLLRMNPDQYKWLEERAKSRLYFPKINAKSKRITDSLSETYFNNDTFAKLGEYINTDPRIIAKWQKATDHYTEMLNLYKTFSPIFLKAPFSLNSCVKVYWSNGQCAIDEINFDDIYYDPYAETSDDIRYIVNRIRKTKGDLLDMQKAGIYKIPAKEIKDTIQETKPYERFELYDVYYRAEDGWELATVYNDSLVLRDKVKLKDGQPFIWGYMLPQIKDINEETFVCAYGEAPVASMLPLQNEMNTTRNQIIDAMKQHLSPKLMIPKTSGISRVDLENPTMPIFTSQAGQITIVPPANTQSALQNIELIERESSEVVGVSPQNNGTAPNRKETATQASIMANEGSVRIQGYVRTFNETFFEPIFERLAKLVWFYGDEHFFLGIDRTNLPSFKVSLNTGIGALNKEVQKQGLMEAYQMTQGQIQAHMALQDIDGAMRMLRSSDKILKEVLPLFGIKDVDEFLGEEKNESGRNFIERHLPDASEQGEGQGLAAEPELQGMADVPNPAMA